MNNCLADMLLQHWAVLQVALKGLWGRRGVRLWGRETGRRRGGDVNMKEKVKGVGAWVFDIFFCFLKSQEINPFIYLGHLLDFAFWWANRVLCVV